MKYATVEYTGTVNSPQRDGPSGVRYSFSSDRVVSVEHLADVSYFETVDVFNVELTVPGKMRRMVDGDLERISDAVSEIETSVKRRIMDRFNIEVNNQEKSELEKVLVEEVETFKRHMEHQ